MDDMVIEAELHGEARTFLEAYCREAPQTPSSVLQALLHERFALRTERFLAELAQVGADDTLTEVLARWTSDLWKARLRVIGSPLPVFYIDGHRKAVYADHLIPRGLVGRQGKVLGCRALVVLHDQEGHPLFVTTHRGDQHLTMGLPAIITRYELAAD